MSLYRVLVAHWGYRVGQVVELDKPIVNAYVKEVPGAVRPGPVEPGDLARPADPGGNVHPRKSKRTHKAVLEVTVDEPDRAVSDSGLPDSES